MIHQSSEQVIDNVKYYQLNKQARLNTMGHSLAFSLYIVFSSLETISDYKRVVDWYVLLRQ